MSPAAPAAEARHAPVLLAEVMDALAVAPGETHVDGTFGAGGYTRAMLGSGAARIFAFDRDPLAIRAGEETAAASGGRLTLVPERFSRMRQALADRGVEAVDGVTLDIGVSSMQLDEAERGFSFQSDGPLDMRMSGGAGGGRSAADIVNQADESEIADILYTYGEEKQSRRIARAIVAARPITRTGDLAAIVRRALGYHPGAKKDPATRTFQAVVTFHSLEDRIVKQFLKVRSGQAAGGSRHRPDAAAGPAPTFERVARKVRPGADELARNPRARSATLRAARRTAARPWTSSKEQSR
jgi:16S rRNA (cytosine1402-N4)-methyltransferase